MDVRRQEFQDKFTPSNNTTLPGPDDIPDLQRYSSPDMPGPDNLPDPDERDTGQPEDTQSQPSQGTDQFTGSVGSLTDTDDKSDNSYHGGVGLARNGYDQIEVLLQHTWGLLADCGCSDGCPACIRSPHCGRANELLDKRLAVTLMMALADPNRQVDNAKPESQ